MHLGVNQQHVSQMYCHVIDTPCLDIKACISVVREKWIWFWNVSGVCASAAWHIFLKLILWFALKSPQTSRWTATHYPPSWSNTFNLSLGVSNPKPLDCEWSTLPVLCRNTGVCILSNGFSIPFWECLDPYLIQLTRWGCGSSEMHPNHPATWFALGCLTCGPAAVRWTAALLEHPCPWQSLAASAWSGHLLCEIKKQSCLWVGGLVRWN